MTNEQATALIIAMLVGLLPNIVLKLLDKYKSKEEVTDIEVNSLTETLESMRSHNKFLEDKLANKKEEITLQNKLMYDLNSQNAILTNQIVTMTEQLLTITNKLQDKENKNAQES